MKCPQCGSSQIDRDDEYQYLECMDCGHTWNDQITKNALHDIVGYETLYDPEV